MASGKEKKDVAADEPAFQRQQIEMELIQVPLRDLAPNHDDFGFRDEDYYNLDGKPVVEMADSIDKEGLHMPLEGKRVGDKVVPVEGQTREAAFRRLNRDNPAKYPLDYKIPVYVYKTEPSDIELLLRLGTPNLIRRQWPEDGLVKFCCKLDDKKCPLSEIVRISGKGEKQVRRYLKLGHCPAMMALVKLHYLTATTAAKLLGAAKDDKLQAALISKVKAWGIRKQADINEENDELIANDKDEKTGSDLWPSKYLKSNQIDAWMNGAKTGKWKEPVFKFVATLAVDPKTKRKMFEMTGIKKPADELHAKDWMKVFKRLRKMSSLAFDEIDEAVKRDRASGDLDEDTSIDDEIKDMLAGRYSDLLDDDDDDEKVTEGEEVKDFGKAQKREQTDLAGTAKLPEDEKSEDESEDEDEESEDEDESEDSNDFEDAGQEEDEEAEDE